MSDSYIFKIIKVLNFMCGCHFDNEENDEKIWKTIYTYLFYILITAGIIYDFYYDIYLVRPSMLIKMFILIKMGEDILAFICIFMSLRWKFKIKQKFKQNLQSIDEIISLGVTRKRRIFQKIFIFYVLYVSIYAMYDCFDCTLYKHKLRFVIWTLRQKMTDFHVMNYLLNIRIIKSRLIIINQMLNERHNRGIDTKEFDLNENALLISAFEKIVVNANLLYKQFSLVVSKHNLNNDMYIWEIKLF